MRISDWSSDVCSSDLLRVHYPEDSVNFGSADDETPLGGAAFYAPSGKSKASCLHYRVRFPSDFEFAKGGKLPGLYAGEAPSGGEKVSGKDGWSIRLMWREDGEGELYEYVYRSEEHTSELQSLMRISYAVFCLQKKNNNNTQY